MVSFFFFFAVENPEHSDVVKLRTMLISTHMQDLKDTTRDVHYENYRAQCISQISQHALRERNKLKRESTASNHEFSDTDRLLLQKDEEVGRRSACVCVWVLIDRFSIRIFLPF